MINNTVNTDYFYTFQVTVCDINVKVAEQVQLKPRGATPATIVSTTRSVYCLNQAWLFLSASS